MYREIKLRKADGTEENYPFMANATTSIRYRQIFGNDLMESVMAIVESAGVENLGVLSDSANMVADGENINPLMFSIMVKIVSSGAMDAVSKLAYVLNRQAEKADMSRIDMEGYIDWLEQFEAMELLSHAVDFIMLYMGNKRTSSTAKKDSAQLIEK